MKLASIELITDIQPHPNADKLDIAKVLGYSCIVGKGDFEVNDVVVLIQPDTLLPEEPWSEMFMKRSSRVRAMKLRGVWSFGIVMALDKVIDPFFFGDQYGDPKWHIGLEISHLIGVTKYEAPTPQHLDAKGPLPYGLIKTDEERFQNITDIPFNDRAVFTLKIDGTSATYYCRKSPATGEWTSGICSRSLELKVECDNNYTRINKKYNILTKLEAFCKNNDVSLALRGEIFGAGIQGHSNNPHSKLPLDFAAFSVFNLDKMEYETSGIFYYQNVCETLRVPMVPVVAVSQLTSDVIKYYAEDITEISGKPFEGVVVKHSQGSFKVINLSYDEHK